MTLDGRTALITGAASGIGAAIADAFAREQAQLLLADREADRLAAVREGYAKSGVTVIATTVDVTDPDQTKAMVDRCIADLGKIDILVNCAGILTEVPLVEMDGE